MKTRIPTSIADRWSSLGALSEMADRARQWGGGQSPSYLRRWGILSDPYRIRESLERQDREEGAAAKILAQHGWYADPDLTSGSAQALAALFKGGQVEKGNETQCLLVERRLPEIEAAIVKAQPKRAVIIGQAFSAHRRGEYALSIPVLLAQADGICNDLFAVQLYARRRNSPEMKLVEKLGSVAVQIGSAIIPLLEASPIAWNQNERKTAGPILNRHAVIHGEDVDYGTRINGCRAVSYIHYTSTYLPMYKEACEPD